MVAAFWSQDMSRNHAMELNSIISIVARTQNANDRRFAIKNAWTKEEIEERRKAAIEMQLRLAALISMVQQKTIHVRRVLEMAS